MNFPERLATTTASSSYCETGKTFPPFSLPFSGEKARDLYRHSLPAPTPECSPQRAGRVSMTSCMQLRSTVVVYALCEDSSLVGEAKSVLVDFFMTLSFETAVVVHYIALNSKSAVNFTPASPSTCEKESLPPPSASLVMLFVPWKERVFIATENADGDYRGLLACITPKCSRPVCVVLGRDPDDPDTDLYNKDVVDKFRDHQPIVMSEFIPSKKLWTAKSQLTQAQKNALQSMLVENPERQTLLSRPRGSLSNLLSKVWGTGNGSGDATSEHYTYEKVLYAFGAVVKTEDVRVTRDKS
eukprot:PhM_4_TR16885/c0_g1_i1/m.66081